MGATGPGNWQRTLPPDPGALFAYGTLRFPEVLRELLGRVPELTEGTVAASGSDLTRRWRRCPGSGG